MVVNYDESFNNNKKKSNYTSKTESTKLLKDSKYIENKNEFVSYLHNWLSMELAFHILGVAITSIISCILLLIHWIMQIPYEESKCSSISIALNVFSIFGFICLIFWCIRYKREYDNENRKYL